MKGTLYAVGVGPGDPELVTIKAARILAGVPVYGFFAKRGRAGYARTIADGYLAPGAIALRFDYPFTTEIPHCDNRYAAAMAAFYQQSAAAIALHLDAGADVAVLCEGDPFFYGSAMYVFDRLASAYQHEVVPGVTGMSGCWASAGLPMTHGDDVLTVLPGTLDLTSLAQRLAGTDAAVVMKIGGNMAKIRAALDHAGRLADAVYVEHGTMAGERIMPAADIPADAAPYFSMVLVPGRRGAR